ncbi:MAG: YceI family protein [Bacteroidota bacterium]|nr:YceI family protein [Bacteroidota bacterium]
MNTTADTQTTNTWQIDTAHTEVGFVVKHMMFAKVRGGFNEFTGSIVQGENGDLTGGSFSATIQTSSVDTGNEDRDAHLRSGDFFDSENFPNITFNSTSVERVAEGQLKVTGELTIRDVTKTITLDVTETGTGVDPWGNMRIGIQAEGTINRKDFGLIWNQALEAGGVLVGEEVTLTIEAQAVAQG